MPLAAAAATTWDALPGTETVTVSKKELCSTSRPAALRDAAMVTGVAVDGLRDRLQPVGAVVDGVDRGDDGQQRLRGADVGGGLLAADVLLAGLQGQTVGRDAGVVLGDTHEAAGQRALQALPHRHVGRVRAAEEQRHAEALRGADGDVRALLARRSDQGQGQQVRRHGDQRAAFLGLGDHGGVVEHPAGDARLLQHDAVDDALGQALGEVGDLDLEAERLGAALDDRDGLRQAVGVEDGLAVVGACLCPAVLLARRISSTASATAVASSSREAFATGRAVRSWTMVWKFSSASSRPWEISGWYGVYAVYQAGASRMLRRITGGVTVS